MSERTPVSGASGSFSVELKSSNIARVEWKQREIQANFLDDEKIAFGVLTVTFANGGQYEYADVPQEQAEAFANAESPGKYFAKEIKGKYEFKKVSA